MFRRGEDAGEDVDVRTTLRPVAGMFEDLGEPVEVGQREPPHPFVFADIASTTHRFILMKFLATRHLGQNDDGHFRCSGSARCCWWAVKDSNLGPAD